MFTVLAAHKARLALVTVLSMAFVTTMAEEARSRSLDDILAVGLIHYCAFPIAADVGFVEPPGCLGEDCAFDGLVRRLTEAFAEELGVASSYYVPSWDEQFHNAAGETIRDASYTLEFTASGRCDVYPSNLIRRDWRMKQLVQIKVFPSPDVVIARQTNRDDITQLEDLAGRTAALVKSSAQHSWIGEQNGGFFATGPVRIMFVPTVNDAFDAIVAMDADVGVVPAYTAYPTLRVEYPELQAAFPVGQFTEHTWAFRKSDAMLQAAFASWVADQQVRQDSTQSRMFKCQYGISYADHVRLATQIE